jgi:hypothetical protein
MNQVLVLKKKAALKILIPPKLPQAYLKYDDINIPNVEYSCQQTTLHNGMRNICFWAASYILTN